MTKPDRTVKILLVEDDPAEVRLIREALAEWRRPPHVYVAEDGDQALAFLRREASQAGAVRPDLILTSLKLPRLDGFSVLAEVKSDPALKTIPVFVFTGSLDPQDVRRSYEMYANCYIIKPLGLDCLFAVLQAIETLWRVVAAPPPGDGLG